VPELWPKATKTNQKQSLEMHAAIGSCMFALIAVEFRPHNPMVRRGTVGQSALFKNKFLKVASA
jgi:hypothetical protein